MNTTSASITASSHEITVDSPDILRADLATIGGDCTITAKSSSPGAPGAGASHWLTADGSAARKVVFAPGTGVKVKDVDGGAAADSVDVVGGQSALVCKSSATLWQVVARCAT